MLHVEIISSKVIWLLAAIFFIYGIFFLRRTLRGDFYPSKINMVLCILRASVILLFLLLILDLSVESNRLTKQAPQIAFLWDMSQSMTADNDYHPASVFKTEFYKKLNRSAEITHISNMSETEVYSVAQLKRLGMKETISDNSQLIRYAEKQTRFDELFLLSDGQSWLGEDLSTLKIKDGLKLNVIAVGEKSPKILPEIRSIRYPEYISQGDSIELKYEIYNPSEEMMDCEVEFISKNAIRKDKINLQAFRSLSISQKIAFDQEGSAKLEWFLNSDSVKSSLNQEILDIKSSKVNIVFYANPSDRDIAMVKYILEDLPRYECYSYKDWIAEESEKTPDVIVANNMSFPAPAFESAPALIFYREGNSEYSLGEQFTIKDYRPFLSVSEDPYENARYWEQLPPLQVKNQAPQGNVLLADSQGRGVIEDRGAVLQINAEGLWAWNLASYQKDWNGLYEHLITGMIEELIGSRSGKMVSFDEKNYFAYAYQPSVFNIDIFDDQLENYSLKIMLCDSNFSEIKRKEGNLADDMFYFKVEQTGDYYMSVDLIVGNEVLASDTAALTIFPNDLENARMGLNIGDLKKLSANNDGMYIAYADLDTAKIELQSSNKQIILSNTFTIRESMFIYLMMFMALVADWILRKMNGGI